ncbi:ubiquilin-2 [Drosophila mauritiana]|uniref:Ubiquilin-2 n=1 Tax=Drosophila mauritiana TaxID=7226 RepID=A0A6P8K1X9_DROMA|nr:ubiquilin-2 [Drosophila mauritiana]
MGTEGSIDICAKGSGRVETVTLRQNEQIRNLRVLVAVRFEQAISRIILVFAGQVLSDEGTIDSRGIVSGVTVHVVCRAEVATSPSPTPITATKRSKPSERLMRSWQSAHIAYLQQAPDVLRSLLQADPRIQSLLDENAAMRHYLNSDQNLREMLSLAFSPAKQELGRRRDLHISRIEFVPGGYKVLSRLNYCMLQAYEDNVAMSFQQASQGAKTSSNPQRGLEVKDPLPNPWLRMPRSRNPRTCALPRRVNKGRSSVKQSDRDADCRQKSSSKVTTSTATQTMCKDRRSGGEGHCQHCYQTQVEQLAQMGYSNRSRNKRALLISLGNVDCAVRLLDHWNRFLED